MYDRKRSGKMKKSENQQEEIRREGETQRVSVRDRLKVLTSTKKKTAPKEKKTQEKKGISEEQIRRFRIGMLCLVAGIAVVVLAQMIVTSFQYNTYEVVEDTGTQNTGVVDYIPYQNSLLKYSKDGAVYVDEKGEPVWNETYAMKMPVADVCGEYVAVADLNGNDVYIFDTEGKVSNTTMPYKVCDIEVAAQGVFAVILEGEKENYINLYDKNGNIILEKRTTIDQGGYPMDMDLSENGEKLFTTYLSIDGGQTKNGLTAFNFGEVGQSANSDRMVGGYLLDNTMVPKVAFLDNNTICAFGDNQFLLYEMRQRSSEKATISLEEEVRSVFYNSSYVGTVMRNDSATRKVKNENAPYVFDLYNTNGRRVLTREIDFNYEHVRMYEKEIIFTGGTECRIYTLSGKLKFSYAFQRNVKDLIPTGVSNRYIILYDNGSEVIRLKHKSEETE